MKITRNMIERTLSAQREVLLERRKLHDRRADRLSTCSHDYERETEDPTEEEEKILDRMITIANREQETADTMKHRAHLIETAIQALESEENAARPRPRVRS